MPEAGRPSRHRELGPLPALRLPGLGAHPRPPASSLSPSHAAPHVLDSVLRETEARVREEVEAKRRREREKERRRRKKHLVATVISLSSFALFMVSGHLISRRYENHDMSQSFLSSEHNHYKFGSFDCVVRQPDGHLRAWDAAPNCRRGFDG